MEDEGKNLQEESSDSSAPRTKVGFPQSKPQKKFNFKRLIVILVILAVLAGGAWFIFGRGQEGGLSLEPSPTPFSTTSTPTPTSEEIDREDIRIQVLNGSGISGQAGDLQSELEELGYSGIEVGNASEQDNETTTVTFSSSVSSGVRDEILEALEDFFEDVDSETGSTGEFDIQIITGYPAGHTPTTAPTSAPTTTATPTPTGQATGTVTPTSTPTPTP